MGAVYVCRDFCSEREGLKKTKEHTNKAGKKKKDYGVFLDSEYCRNTFDIFPDLLARSRADSGTQFPNVAAQPGPQLLI